MDYGRDYCRMPQKVATNLQVSGLHPEASV
jgi:hypothetical protein